MSSKALSIFETLEGTPLGAELRHFIEVECNQRIENVVNVACEADMEEYSESNGWKKVVLTGHMCFIFDFADGTHQLKWTVTRKEQSYV